MAATDAEIPYSRGDRFGAYTVSMAQPMRTYSREEFNARHADAGEPTPDDVSILADGRRLDTPDKVRAFYAEMRKSEPDLDGLDL